MEIEFTKTVREADVYLWAGLSGDFSPVHMDEEFARGTEVGERIAHGVMLLSLIWSARSRWLERSGIEPAAESYERIRFIAPVRFGDEITVTYGSGDPEGDGGTLVNVVEARNQDGIVVGAARHLIKPTR